MDNGNEYSCQEIYLFLTYNIMTKIWGTIVRGFLKLKSPIQIHFQPNGQNKKGSENEWMNVGGGIPRPEAKNPVPNLDNKNSLKRNFYWVTPNQ